MVPVLSALAATTLTALVTPALADPGPWPRDSWPRDPSRQPPSEHLDDELVEPTVPSGPFARPFGISAYYAGWAGGYDAGGVGFRLRWEPFTHLGLEVYSELLDATVPVGSRLQLPSGFNLYIPIEPLADFRVRALAGLCTMFVFNSAAKAGGVDTQDVQFGVHLGAGAELALHDQLSVFLDLTYQGYWGNRHSGDAWSGALNDELDRTDSAQLGLGLQLHL